MQSATVCIPRWVQITQDTHLFRGSEPVKFAANSLAPISPHSMPRSKPSEATGVGRVLLSLSGPSHRHASNSTIRLHGRDVGNLVNGHASLPQQLHHLTPVTANRASGLRTVFRLQIERLSSKPSQMHCPVVGLAEVMITREPWLVSAWVRGRMQLGVRPWQIAVYVLHEVPRCKPPQAGCFPVNLASPKTGSRSGLISKPAPACPLEAATHPTTCL